MSVQRLQSDVPEGHFVHFYEDEAGLAGIVGRFVVEGLESGEKVLLVCTPARAVAVREAVAAAALDVLARDRLIVLDAETTIGEIVRDGEPDPERFHQVVGAALERVATSGRPVRVFGEMVDVLWKRGEPEAALRLEELWNDAGQSRPFSLLCSYAMASFYKVEGDMERVCSLHDRLHHSAEPDSTRRLEAEIAHRRAVEAALRDSLRSLREGRARAEILYTLTARANGAQTVEQVFEFALDAVCRAAPAERAAILTCDGEGALRHKAWRGVSDGFRAAVERLPRLPIDAANARIVVVPDASRDEALAPLGPLLQREGIASLHVVPLVAAGRLVGAIMIHHDATRELTPAERNLFGGIAAPVADAIVRFGALEELRQAVKFQDVFTGIVSHDLRNPLTAVINAAQLAMLRDHDEKITRPLSRILSSGSRMARLIDQLLDFTRIRMDGGLSLRRSPLDMVEHLRAASEELRTANTDWTIRLEHRGNPAGAWDPDRLLQLFSNLIGNAGQHGRGGPVEVAFDGTSEPEVAVEIHNEGEIPPERMKTLFQPMRSANESGRGGLGLGLFIAREIVRAHDGAIDVRSAAGRTTFRVVLPRGRVPEEA